MANTASITLSLSISNGTAGGSASAATSFSPTLAGAHFISAIQSVGTGAEVVMIEDIATLGYLFIKNLDGTNYVEISTDGATFAAGKVLAKLKAGEFILIPAEPGVTYGARANTGACDCQVLAIEA